MKAENRRSIDEIIDNLAIGAKLDRIYQLGIHRPQFSPFHRCAKCGWQAVGISYHFISDALMRNCKRCGFRWREAPLDDQANHHQ